MTVNLDALTVQVDINANNISILEVDVRANRTSIDAIVSTLKTVRSEIAVLSSDVELNAVRIAVRIAELNADVDRLTAEWTAKFETATAALDAMAIEVTAQGAALENFYAEFLAHSDRVDAQIAGLTAEIDAVRSEVANNVAITASELASASYRISNLNAQVNGLNTQLSQLQNKFDNHRHSYEDTYDKYTYYVAVYSHQERYIVRWVGPSIYTADCRKPGAVYVTAHRCKYPIYAWRAVYVQQARIGYSTRTLSTSTAY